MSLVGLGDLAPKPKSNTGYLKRTTPKTKKEINKEIDNVEAGSDKYWELIESLSEKQE